MADGCLMEKCKTCKEYSTCPVLSAILQRSYSNRSLDSISNSLLKIEKLLDERVNGKKKGKE